MPVHGERRRARTDTYGIALSSLLTKRAGTLGGLLRLRTGLAEIESDILGLDRCSRHVRLRGLRVARGSQIAQRRG